MFQWELIVARLVAAAVIIGALTAPVSGLDIGNGLVRITFLQLNDVYGIAPVDNGENGGLARVATMRKEILKQTPDATFVLCGDTLSPSVTSRTFQGRQMIAAWNQMGLDLACLGNHEFDFGPEVLLQRIKESHFKWICANAINKSTGKTFGNLDPYVIRDIDGVKVGIFALLTPDTANCSQAGPNVTFSDPVKVAQVVVPEMRAHGARVIVALTHLSLAQDKTLAQSGLVDLVLGGHDHAVLESLAGHAPIIKVGSDARNLGRIDINVSKKDMKIDSIDWKLLPVTSKIKDDEGLKQISDQFEKQLTEQLNQPIATSRVSLDGTSTSNRAGETNLGDFIADAYRHATSADIGLINGGAIRGDHVFAPGMLTKRDVLTMLPFEGPVVKLAVPGKDVLKMLEHGVGAQADDHSGRFPQVSGLKFSFDPRKPADSRVIDVSIDGRPLDPDHVYSVATNAYVAKGGDGYTMLTGKKYLITPEEGDSESVIVINALKRAAEVSPAIEGRITRVN